MKLRRDTTARPGIALVEEAGNLLRSAPPAAWLCYHIGAIPFVLLLLRTITFAHSGFRGHDADAGDALLLALAFIWMKCWQAVFAERLGAHLRGIEPARWPLRRIARLIAQQTVLQPAGLLAIPASILVVVPFGWAHAWYQNVTVLGQGEGGVMEVARRASTQSRLWPFQNHIGIWLVSPWLLGMGLAFFFLFMIVLFKTLPAVLMLTMMLVGFGSFMLFVGLSSPLGLIICGNIAAALMFVPWAAHHWFGWRTEFTLVGWHGIFNTTFLLTCFCLSYLLLDPLMKAFYVLRCFYGHSRATGEDLRIEIRPRARVAPALATTALVLLATLIAVPDRATAQDAAQPTTTTVDPTSLDRSIDDVLKQPEFQWRLPDEELIPGQKKAGVVGSFLEKIAQMMEDGARWVLKQLERFERALRKALGGRDTEPLKTRSGGGPSALGTFLVYLLIAAILVVAVLLLKRWRASRKAAQPVNAVAAQPLPDIHDETVLANRLPADEWLAMARDFMAKGEWRPALRALFLSHLAALAQRELITIARGKSNHDYLRELQRRSHALPEVPPNFGANMNLFERVWYGRDPAGPELAHEFEDRLQHILWLFPKVETEAARV